MSQAPTVPQSALDAALPNVTASLSFDVLDGPVTIYRDGYGIPHVRAATTHDAFFGQGFATAQDRLFQMDHDRRWAYGRWAEFAGESAVEQDALMRRFQLSRSVERDYGAINAETRAMFEAYAEGVNGFIETTESLPVEYAMLGESPEAWTAQDCLAVFKARHVLMGHMEAKLWRAKMVATLGAERAAELMPQYEKGGLLIVPPGAEYFGDNYDALSEYVSGAEHVDGMADADSGSNNWAVHGDRTASGKPLAGGRPAPPHRDAERLLPEPYRVRRVRRDGAVVSGVSGVSALRAQRAGRVVRDPCRGGLPGPLRRVVPGRVVAALRGQRRLETRRDPQRGDPRQGLVRPSRSRSRGRITGR